MNMANLDTTNVLLGIMAAVSVLEALLLIAIGVMAYRLFTQAMQTVRDIERRQVAPLVATVHALVSRVDGVLVDVKAVVADVKGVTTRVGQQTELVDTAIRGTMHKVDETAERVRTSVASRVNRVLRSSTAYPVLWSACATRTGTDRTRHGDTRRT